VFLSVWYVVQAMWFSPNNALLTNDYASQSLDTRFSVVKEYQRERNLRITSVQLSDDGIYKCKEAGTQRLLGEVRLRVNGTLPDLTPRIY